MNVIQPTAPTVAANSAYNNTWLGGAQDFLKFGLDSWMQVETINKLKDSGTIGQAETLTTVQSPTTVTAVDTRGNAASTMQEQLTDLMNKGGLIMGGLVVGVAALYFLTRK